ncbi:MAG: hypothetical protein ABIH18_09870 [Candidatus Omnitrophota bacterium]
MKKLIKITYKKKIIAFIIKNNFKTKGLETFTPHEFPQQLIYMNRPKGYLIGSHIHLPAIKQIESTQEMLFIRSGKVRIDFYDGKKHYLESRVVKQGDVVFLAFGGHGFEFMEGAEIIEVKQGPFFKEIQPVRFEAVKKDKIKLKK